MNNKHYKIEQHKVLFTFLENEGVLYDIEKNQYLSINATYTSIFMHIEKGMRFDGIVDELMKEYDVTKEICEKQLEQTINELLQKGHISEIDDPKA